MSWDYNFNTFHNSFNTSPLGTSNCSKATIPSLNSQLDKNPSISSLSSESTSSVNNMGTEEEAKLLPQNLWGETSRNSNTFEESQFFQNQLQNADNLWYQKSLEQQQVPQASHASELQHSQSSQSIFDMKYNTLNNYNSSVNNNNSFNYTASTTPISSTTPPIPQFNSPTSPNAFNNFQALNNMNPQNLNSLGNNTQNLLQSYQQQQQYLEQLQQEQQQQQQQLLQNPLFLQQQAQLVSQQLQQLQLQLQFQQQQIENANQLLNKKIELSEKLPLTQENLTKLEQAPVKESSIRSADSTSTGDKNAVNTELYKTELCSTFQRTGSCPYGTKCQFAHGQHELKHVQRGSKWRSKPCANWTKTGSCRYGNRCCFKHSD